MAIYIYTTVFHIRSKTCTRLLSKSNYEIKDLYFVYHVEQNHLFSCLFNMDVFYLGLETLDL